MKLNRLEQALYDCIDDIDTASDAFKDNYRAYQMYVEKRIKKYHSLKLTTCDGYTVTKLED